MENIENKLDMHHHGANDGHNGKHSSAMYKRFAIMAVAMFAAMYFLMKSEAKRS